MTRLSQYLLPTVKDPPADAEAISHRLLVRAGLVRQVGTGLWSYLPAGWRVHRKVEQIVREELDAVGSQEMLMPVITPAELWKKTGRYDIDEVFKLQDRKGAELVLAMTHEETLTFHMAREVRSYRDLPLILYHFQTKGRDEPRPRAGILRTREFIMKDAYTFDRDREGLDRQYDLLARAYDRIFDRCGLEWYSVESDVGMMGGFGAHEYMAPCAAGENEVALSDAGYAANVEVASAAAQPVDGLPEPLDAPEPVDTPGVTTIDAVAQHARRPEGRAGQGVPGHRRRRPAGARARPRRPPRQRDQAPERARRDVPPADARTRSASGSAPSPDTIGPVGIAEGVEVMVRRGAARSDGAGEPARTSPTSTCAASSPAATSSRPGRDIRSVEAGDTDPSGAVIRIERAIEVGNIFKLGTRFSEPLGRPLPRRERQGAAHLDGLLRHRPGAHHGRRRRAVRRRRRHLVAAVAGALGRRAGHAREAGRARARLGRPAVRRAQARRGSTCSTTSATASAGEKFADAELLGCRCG